MSFDQKAITLFIGLSLAISGAASGNAVTEQLKGFTKDECKGVGAVFMEVAKRTKTSDDFRNSMIAWINPPTFACDGPRDIVVRTGIDSDAFNTIRSLLGSLTRPIDMVARGGLRAVAPTPAPSNILPPETKHPAITK